MFQLMNCFFPSGAAYKSDTFDSVNFIRPYVENGDIHHMPVNFYKNDLHDIPETADFIRNGKATGT